MAAAAACCCLIQSSQRCSEACRIRAVWYLLRLSAFRPGDRSWMVRWSSPSSIGPSMAGRRSVRWRAERCTARPKKHGLDECNDIAPHGGRAAPLAAGARLIAAPTPRRRHLARRGAALRRRQNGRELAARPRQQKQQRLNFSFSSRLVLSQAHTRATCARVAAFAPRRIRTGSQPARRRRAAAKCTTLTSLRCCCFGTS